MDGRLHDRGAKASSGVTLIELLITLALIAVLATSALPAFRQFSLDARRTTHVNALLHALHAARSAAILRGQPTVICKSADQRRCTPGAASWSEGWIVFANADHDSPPVVDANEDILFVQARVEQLSIESSRNAVFYWPVALAGTTATFIFCDERGTSAARAIIVSQTGRPRISARDSAGKPLKCKAAFPN
jgi:type IV fimbrial biogenesis protein FimT